MMEAAMRHLSLVLLVAAAMFIAASGTGRAAPEGKGNADVSKFPTESANERLTKDQLPYVNPQDLKKYDPAPRAVIRNDPPSPWSVKPDINQLPWGVLCPS